MNEVRIFFDLDGVLADMEGGLRQKPEILELRAVVDELIDTKFNDYKDLVDDDIKTKFKAELEANPESPVKELKKAFQKYTSKVFSIAAKEGFYRNLPLMPGAEEMVEKAGELLSKVNGKLPIILSSPVGDENDPNNISIKEKKDWVDEHFKGMFQEWAVRVNDNFTSDKGRVVKSKNDILIDDRPKYVEKFTGAGGTAILHTDYRKTIAELKSIFQEMQKGSGMQTETPPAIFIPASPGKSPTGQINERRFVKTYDGFIKK